ncbi:MULTISPECIES: class II aldolase/adducin family protein [Delftia]|uniref:class II aldolase/adducin family protein n=1 Tax=Delftia TaxID=80865 RepID=UPI0023B2071F|nr:MULTISPECIES: class II aldolase/adducin family protein [Delftia]MDH0850195.1 class II aldolase/adducin family protein [Delftia tsuruhatensis]
MPDFPTSHCTTHLKTHLRTHPTSHTMNCSMHPEERAARIELAACYRVFAMLGWDELIYNHITVRLPDSVTGGEKQFLINPFGLHYEEVTASNLVRINVRGEVLDGSRHPVNPAGFVVHAAIHDGLPGAHCVMHTHTTSGMGVACLEQGLSQSNFYSAQLHGMVAYHDFEGITIHADEGPRLLASIGHRKAVILRNHGLLSWGSDLPQAFVVLWTLQRACDVQMATLSMGAPRMVSDAMAQRCNEDSLTFNDSHGGARDVFDHLVRRVNRRDSSYLDL